MTDEQSSSIVSPSLSLTPSASASPTSTNSSWHGLSSAVNQPEAEQALDLAKQAFAAGRYYKAERLCLRSIRLYETAAGNEMLARVYDKIPHARPGVSSSSTSSASASPPPSSSATPSSSPPPAPTSAPSSPSSQSHSSSPFASASLPGWLTVPMRYRVPLLTIWSLVLLVALLRYYGVIAAFDHAFAPHHSRQQPTHAAYGGTAQRGRGSVGGVSGGGSVGGWLLGLTNLFPLVLMLLFASGQWQRWLQHQQQQRTQQH